jgi:hypothetical protein
MHKTTALTIVTVLILVGFALRLYRLDAIPLRGDEAFSAVNWSGLPIAESLATIATIEPHPPLTYVIFRIWGVLIGIDHELMLRLLPTLVNLIGIPALYALGTCFFGRNVGVLAALLWALHPFQIWHAQDFRNYALWAGMSAITLWLAWRIITGKRRPVDWLLYAIGAGLTGFTFYFELLSIGTVGLYVLIVHRKEHSFVLRWFVLNGMISMLVILAFLFFQGSLVGSGSYAGTGDRVDFLQLITRFLPALMFGETISKANEVNAMIGFGLLGILAFCLWLIAQRNKTKAFFLLLLAMIPPLLLAIVAVRLGIFNPRYVLLSIPAYLLIFCGGIVRLWQQRIGKYIAIISIFGVLVISIFSLNNHYHDSAYRKAPGWKALAAYLSANVAPDDLVIQTAVDAAFGYYYDYFDIPALDIALPGNFDQPIAEITQILEDRHSQYNSLWVVATTFESWANHGVVEAWVDTHMQRTRFTVTDGLPVRQYMTWEISPNEIFGQALAVYADQIELPAAQVFLEPTHELTIWLYWRPLAQTETSLKVFVHLIGAINPATGSSLWSQADAFPQQGRVMTDNWQIGTLYRDVYRLNLQAVPAGEYQLLVGFYDPNTGERLITAEDGDSVVIQKIVLP